MASTPARSTSFSTQRCRRSHQDMGSVSRPRIASRTQSQIVMGDRRANTTPISGRRFRTAASRRDQSAVKQSDPITGAVLEAPFEVESITQITPPEGAHGTWCGYVISQGGNRITGMRAGTRAEVCLLVEEMVLQLNERRRGKWRAPVR